MRMKSTVNTFEGIRSLNTVVFDDQENDALKDEYKRVSSV